MQPDRVVCVFALNYALSFKESEREGQQSAFNVFVFLCNESCPKDPFTLMMCVVSDSSNVNPRVTCSYFSTLFCVHVFHKHPV